MVGLSLQRAAGKVSVLSNPLMHSSKLRTVCIRIHAGIERNHSHLGVGCRPPLGYRLTVLFTKTCNGMIRYHGLNRPAA